MADYIERGLRQIEEKNKQDPDIRMSIARIRAEMWQAVANGHFPQTIEIEDQAPSVYEHPLFEFHREMGLIIKNGQRANLTASEGRILNNLSKSPNMLVTRAVLAGLLRGSDSSISQDLTTVNVHVSHLRKKLSSEPGLKGDQSIIRTIRDKGMGSGYMLIDASRPFQVSGELEPGKVIELP